MPDQQLINLARTDAQGAAASNQWDPEKADRTVAFDQSQSDRLSSPNHRLSVMKAHPATVAANPGTSGPHPASQVQ